MSGCYLRSQLLYRGKHLVVKLDDIYYIDVHVHILVLNQIIAILYRCTCDCVALLQFIQPWKTTRFAKVHVCVL